jgi:hypothetical protein
VPAPHVVQQLLPALDLLELAPAPDHLHLFRATLLPAADHRVERVLLQGRFHYPCECLSLGEFGSGALGEHESADVGIAVEFLAGDDLAGVADRCFELAAKEIVNCEDDGSAQLGAYIFLHGLIGNWNAFNLNHIHK